ncbi:TIGR04222 domain-containing membrane protein [Nocardiopsis suaedae]|uniref:TIGR04222 domain-containing membrane protein n=1 Tax=Nocardiopsis suaedae TaxID=3018444 RepID=A0ABT4TRJ6_9ACTN|nr:TIGR04222 domain-containing membrane protein [Nocardiopsis suaedae]MDA2807310.1 TIGR04222 domain-containing membrane protein [Nocardiopsis suaedae]
MLGPAVYPALMLVAGLVYAGYAVALVRRAHALVREYGQERERGPGTAPQGPIGTYELAFLAGGERRAAEAAVAEAVLGGHAGVDLDGTLRASGVGAPGTAEASAVAALLDREGPVRLDPLLRRLATGGIALPARAAVTGRGLFLGEDEVLWALARRRSVLRVGWLGMAVAGALAVLLVFAGAATGGTAAWWTGPAGGMAVLFFVLGAALLVDRVVGPERLAPVTRAGAEALAEADAPGAADTPGGRDVRLVGLLGLAGASEAGAHPPGTPLARLAAEAEAVSWSSDLVETALGDGGGPWLAGPRTDRPTR